MSARRTAAMGYVFRPGLHACDPGGSLVLLDIRGDRYFALGGAMRDVCLRLADDISVPNDRQFIAELVACDFLRQVDGMARPELCTATPVVRTCAVSDATRAATGHLIAALARHSVALTELKVRSFQGVLRSVARAKQRRSTPDDGRPNPSAFVAAFASADRMMTASNRCLPRSIALARAMIAGGLGPELVLGVKLRPFEAHCWVQLGDSLVGDEVGTITPFTPILVI